MFGVQDQVIVKISYSVTSVRLFSISCHSGSTIFHCHILSLLPLLRSSATHFFTLPLNTAVRFSKNAVSPSR